MYRMWTDTQIKLQELEYLYIIDMDLKFPSEIIAMTLYIFHS